MTRIVVIGDALLDCDVDGAVDRLCPDAPVPVLTQRSAVERAGGAGLAAALAAADGNDVALVTALADDPAGARLAGLLSDAGVEVYALPMAGTTVEKVRLRSVRRTLLRLDRGTGGPIGAPPAAALAAITGADAVLVSDYGHGVARQPELRRAVAATVGAVVWDPHPRGPAAVAGARLVTPNEDELRRLAGDGDTGQGASASTVDGSTASRLAATARSAQALRERWRAAAVAVTRGADGALLCHAGPTPMVVAPPMGVPAGADPCGAGDSFAAAATAALARGALVSEAVQQAVARATLFVAGTVDAASPRRGAPRAGAAAAADVVRETRAAGGTVVATGGCFDLLHTGHLATLRAARALGDCLIVCLNSDRSVRALKGPDRPMTPQADRARLLAALDCVDAVVVFDEATPEVVLSWLRPDIWVKGGDYSDSADLPESQLVKRWGGQSVIVPYLPGRSTTATIAAVRTRQEAVS
jgi:rfaE bifunctional protein nucleotidyltransferase chain/domain/rfaE bifunctional protein kinase chain/domain